MVIALPGAAHQRAPATCLVVALRRLNKKPGSPGRITVRTVPARPGNGGKAAENGNSTLPLLSSPRLPATQLVLGSYL